MLSIHLKYEQHPSINLIKENITNNESFHFLPTEWGSILKEVINLDDKKMELLRNIPIRHLKDVSDRCSALGVKKSTQIRVKQKDKTFFENYRPVSVLPTVSVSKIFERKMQKKFLIILEKIFSSFLCPHRKGFNTQYTLLTLIERWKFH